MVRGGRIRTSDLRFIRHGLQPIELPLGDRIVLTISRHFTRVLMAVSRMMIDIINPIDREFKDVLSKIRDDERYWPYFKDCIRAIDGPHVPVKFFLSKQISYIGRKWTPTQNVMVVCDFRMCFTFV